MLRKCVAVVVCLAAFAPALADDKPPAQRTMPPPAPPALSPAAEPEKTYTIYLKDTDWDEVLGWYANASGLKAGVKATPKGTFTFLPEKGRKFTIAEITDLINEELAKQKLVLIPHRKTFAVVSTEGKIDPKLIPVVEWSELPHLGRTAIVETTVPLEVEADKEIVTTLNKLFGPLIEVVSAKDKSIVVRGDVETVLQMREALRPL